MLKFIENLLSAFLSCFSRNRTYEWFLVIVSALLVRYDSLGVTSFVRVLSLDRRLYETMLNFFHSSAYKTADLKTCWHKIIHRNAPLICIGGRRQLFEFFLYPHGSGHSGWFERNCFLKERGSSSVMQSLYISVMTAGFPYNTPIPVGAGACEWMPFLQNNRHYYTKMRHTVFVFSG